jgi:GntR family transcriptional regulator, transcriptional repressor for pyruvate dehydrogenase complex
MTASNGREAMATPFSPTPVMRPVDQVRLSIVQAIATGRLRPGDRLPPEAEQARGFDVSRASVREALRSLVDLGLVRTVPGRGGGTFINQANPDPVARNLGEAMDVLLHLDAINVAELLEARRALERTCARLAAGRHSVRHIAAMEQILATAQDPQLPSDAWLALDVRFHREAAVSAGNRVLLVPLSALHAIVQPRLNGAIEPLLDREKINAQHGAIVAGIRERDPEAATAAVDDHLDHLEQLYRGAGVL